MTKKCTPTCPYFKCAKRALIKRGRKYGRNSRSIIALCAWANDLCQGAKCTFAYCQKRALLPDGTCGLEQRKRREKIRSIEEEAEKEELKVKLKGKALRKLKDWKLN